MNESCSTVTDVRVLEGYCVELKFSDGVQGAVDLANRIVGRGGVFAALEDLHFFRKASIEKELGTIVWPNGADFCPDLLYRWVTGEPIQRPESETIASR